MRTPVHEAAYALRRVQLLRKAKARGVEVPEGATINEIQTLIQQDEVQRAERR